MNTLAVGRRRERVIGDWLVTQGYFSKYWQPPQAKWADSDIFGCFDLFCYTDYGYPWLVQVTKWNHHKERIERIEAFMKESGLGGYVSWMVVGYKLKKRSIIELRIITGSSWETEEGEVYKVDIPA